MDFIKSVALKGIKDNYTVDELCEMVYEGHFNNSKVRQGLKPKERVSVTVSEDNPEPDVNGTKNLGLALGRLLANNGEFRKYQDASTGRWVYETYVSFDVDSSK